MRFDFIDERGGTIENLKLELCRFCFFEFFSLKENQKKIDFGRESVGNFDDRFEVNFRTIFVKIKNLASENAF